MGDMCEYHGHTYYYHATMLEIVIICLRLFVIVTMVMAVMGGMCVQSITAICTIIKLLYILVNVPARVHYRIECTRNASRANRARGAAECSIMHRDAFRVHSIR